MEFVYPLSPDELLGDAHKRGNPVAYRVETLFPLEEIRKPLEEFHQRCRESPTTSIRDYFDVFFAINKDFKDVEIHLQDIAWKILFTGFKSQINRVQDFLCDFVSSGGTMGDSDGRRENRNALQMYVYLISWMATNFESDVIATNRGQRQEIIGTAKKSQKKKPFKSLRIEDEFDTDRPQVWEKSRRQLIGQFARLLTLELYNDEGDQREMHRTEVIRFLWSDPPVVDQNFSNGILNCVCKFLENPEVAQAKCKDLMTELFNVLFVLIRDYGRCYAVAEKLIAMLQQNEHLGVSTTASNVSVLADGIAKIVNTNEAKTFLPEVMRELGRLEWEDLSKEGIARSISNFLITLATKCPRELCSHISPLSIHLSGEAYSLRNAVLVVYLELILTQYSKEGMNEAERSKRDGLLFKIKEHLLDITAFVRAKCISLWIRLAEAKRIPLRFLRDEKIVECIAGRLDDKSSLVRKNALQFLTVFLESNPYRYSFKRDRLNKGLENAIVRLANLKKDNDTHSEIVKKGEEAWNEISGRVREYIFAILKKMCSEEPVKEEEEDYNDDERMDDQDLSGSSDGEMDPSENETLPKKQSEKSLSKDNPPPEGWPNYFYKLLSTEQEKLACEYLVKFSIPDRDKNRNTEETNVEELSSIENNQMSLDQIRENMNESVDVFANNLQTIFLKLKIEELSSDTQGSMDYEIEEDDMRLDEGNVYYNEFLKLNRDINYYKETISFVTLIENIMKKVCYLFASRNNSDVLEAITFVVTCAKFKVPGNQAAVRRLCNLIWRNDEDITKQVVEAFRVLYLQTERAGDSDSHHSSDSSKDSQRFAANLIALVKDASVSELASLERLVMIMMKNCYLSKNLLNLLWTYFSKREEYSVPEEESKCALMLLQMVGSAEKTIILHNMDILIDTGLGPRAEKDFSLAKEACYALSKLGTKIDLKDEDSIRKNPLRFPQEHRLFTRLQQLLLEGMTRFDDDQYTPLMEHALNVIFYLAEHPDVIATGLLLRMSEIYKNYVQKYTESQEKDDFDGNSKDDMEKGINILLVRLLSTAGHIALRFVIHLEVAYIAEQKRRKEVLFKKKDRRLSMLKDGKRLSSPSSPNVDACEEELGLKGAAADDQDQEFVTKVLETEPLNPEHAILGRISSLVIEILAAPHGEYSPAVQSAAAIALSKMMLINSEFCSNNLRLFFSLLRSSWIPSVRSILMIAAGDLSFRFPNEIEPWSSQLYDRLYDEDQAVRQNCLLVLTHLILNNMIKVKGFVADIAKCMLDRRQEMAGLAKRFFFELSKSKTNAIYNLMPDIISRLSDPKTKVDLKEFKQIIKFLFGFIQRDRQYESLVEKLCQRFQYKSDGDENKDLWRYLSFCLTQISYNDKSFKRLQENMHCYSAKLKDEEVMDNFNTIVTNLRRSLKTLEAKELLQEWDEAIQEYHRIGAEDQAAINRADENWRMRSRHAPTTPRTPKTATRRARLKTTQD